MVFPFGLRTWTCESWGGVGFGAPEMLVTLMALCFLWSLVPSAGWKGLEGQGWGLGGHSGGLDKPPPQL